MKEEVLNIASPISPEAAERVGASLKALPGVQDVSFLDSPARLHVLIDGDAPTRAELVAVLAKAGVQVEEERRAPAIGSCCGGCGS